DERLRGVEGAEEHQDHDERVIGRPTDDGMACLQESHDVVLRVQSLTTEHYENGERSEHDVLSIEPQRADRLREHARMQCVAEKERRSREQMGDDVERV